MKNKILSLALSSSLILSAAALPASASSAVQEISYNYSYNIGDGYLPETVHTRQMEKLDRGLVAVKSGSGVFLSWRLFDSEDARYGSAENNVSFNVYRDNVKIAEVESSTNYTDATAGTNYSVAPVVNGIEGEKCEPVTVMNNIYFDIPLVKPENETIDEGGTAAVKSFSPTDCSTGDLDGDGKYEIIVKWVSKECDVGNGGYSGTVRFSAYKLDGTKLWDNDINLGKNVYSSAHTAQFVVYDFDGDGKSEMMVQTSLGSTDSKGVYVSHSAKADSVVASTGKKIAEYTDEENASADFNGYDRKISGEEFLTVFNGETGEAVDTIDLPTTRGSAKGVDYGDDFGNRSNRFVASVAYLDGEKPYAVYLRGYYFGKNGKQRTSIAGISFDGERLSPDYRFDTQKNQPGYYDGAEIYVGQGNHNCTVADVDNDGKDEFITGALCMEVKDDNTFKPRWCTFLEHGDALHIGDYDPTHSGFEFFTVHEDGKDSDQAGPDGIIGTDDDYGYVQENAKKAGKDVICNFGMSVIDANTGDIIFHKGNTKDTGRGCMANIGSGGYYQITGVGNYQCNGGTNFTTTRNGAGSNFRIFWDGDLYDELLDGTNVTNYNGNGFNAGNYDCTKINGTKSNPSLQADLFGDWREELVYPTNDGTKLRVFTTTTPTEYKIKTLMHDPVYRSGVAAEQTAYNQPPHVGMYLGEEMFMPEVASIEINSVPSKTSYAPYENLDTTGLTVTAHYIDGTSAKIKNYAVSAVDTSVSGTHTVTVKYKGKSADFDISVKSVESIKITSLPLKTAYIPGEKLDVSGLTVTATFTDGTSAKVSEYTLSGYDEGVTGKQIVTVTYAGKTADFDVRVHALTGIVVSKLTSSATAYLNMPVNTYGIEITASFDDGSTMIVPYSDCVFIYDTSKLGESTVTVKYNNMTTQFPITVIAPDIGILNRTYFNDRTESSTLQLPIGTASDSFTIEHTVKINSMPANGNENKNDASGFFVRFMASTQADPTKMHTGGGWYLTANNDKANVYWKSGASRNNAINIATGNTALTLGETYTFKYDFSDVGTGNGAKLTLSVIDSSGKTISSVSNLNVRNFTDTNTGKTSPITIVEIHNQANEGSVSEVVFDNAIVYGTGKITSVDGGDISFSLTGSASGIRLFAAKYLDNGTLDKIEVFDGFSIGENTVSASFAPDKVFLWSGVTPLDCKVCKTISE